MSKQIKLLVIGLLLTSTFNCAFAETPLTQAVTSVQGAQGGSTMNFAFDTNLAQVRKACASEAQIAGCKNDEDGFLWLRCLDHHRVSNRGWKASDGCQASIETFIKGLPLAKKMN